jgi:hypothetical protein
MSAHHLVEIDGNVEQSIGVAGTGSQPGLYLVDEEAHEALGVGALCVVLAQVPHQRHHPLPVLPAPVQLVVRLEV